MQRCPAHPDIDATMFVDAISTSASGMTMRWFLAPPNASTRLRFAVPRRYTTFATFVDPTKLIAAMPE